MANGLKHPNRTGVLEENVRLAFCKVLAATRAFVTVVVVFDDQ